MAPSVLPVIDLRIEMRLVNAVVRCHCKNEAVRLPLLRLSRLFIVMSHWCLVLFGMTKFLVLRGVQTVQKQTHSGCD